MKALFIREFGGPESLEITEVPGPAGPVGDEVIVAVKAAGLNRADILQRKGLYPPPAGYSAKVPGLEFAGEITEAGPESSFRPGVRVMGITAGEAQAEFLKIASSQLIPIPDNLSFSEAAALPEAFITAYDALMSQAGLRSGETVLIHAAGSGVGLPALRIAKAFGAVTIGTSRTADKLGKCSALGLDHGIVTADGPHFAEHVMEITRGRGADVILDLVGGTYFEENLKALALRGRLMLVGLTAGRRSEIDLGIALSKRLTIRGTVLRSRSPEEKAAAVAAFRRDLLPMFARGELRPDLDRVFKMDDAAEAHVYIESNESFGKVVLEW